MNVSSLISTLKNQGIKIQFMDENLKISDPGDKLTPTLLAEIKAKKAEIIAFFKKYARKQDDFTAIAAAEKQEYYPLSSAQRRLYIVQRMADDSISYNMPSVLELTGTIDKERMTAAFRDLVMRHESFRTTFRQVGEEPVQLISNPGEVEFKIEYYSGERDSMKRFIRPFDLTRVSLMRVGLIEGTGAVPRFLMIDMHHIISDGTSIATIIREFMTLYAAQELPYLRIQYKEYSQWQSSDRQKKAVIEQEAFWLSRFAGEIPVLNLPTDYTRPPIQSFKGESVHFEIGKSGTGRLKAMAAEADATIYIVLLSIANTWLGKLTGQEEVIVGTPTAGRGHADLENIIGMFVNTLALWNYPVGTKTFREFLDEVKNESIAAFANQDYQYEDLVEKAAITRDMSRNPLFDFMFSLQNLGIPKIESLPIQMKTYSYEVGVAKFDLALDVLEEDDKLEAKIDYSTALFSRETIQRFSLYFKEIVSSVLADPDRQLRQIEMIPQTEKDRLLYEFNDTEADYPKDKSIHRVFAEQAEQSPHRTAVADIGQKTNSQVHLTYRELDRRAQKLAGLLLQKGMMPGAVAALTAESRIEMIIALLGILKAGAAYLPIDPAYPEDRKNYILNDSGARALISTGASHDNDWCIENRCGHVVEFTQAFSPGRLAYIIYTSGTTGRPKGVIIDHSSVLRLVKNPNFMEFREGKRLLMTGALVFDISTLEIWGPLLNGLTLYIIAKETTLDAGKLSEAIINNDISILHLIPQLFNHVFEHTPHGFSRLEYFLVGGDLVRPEPVSRLREMYPNLKIVHAYGPTENTTFSTTYQVDRTHGDKLPIGKPISNSSVYILDRYGDLQLTGVPGELCVGGDGLSRGYLNNPELTAEKFVAFGESEPFCKKVPTPPKTFNKSFLGVKGAIFQKSPLASIYKTGDMARWLTDGNIEFLGRMDFQVKIRGMRIELGEIENRLRAHGHIKDAVVLDINAAGGEKYICAYIVSKDRQEIDATLLRDYLSQALPDYMIPAHFIFIDSIPLNPNGKVDRKVLPIPEFQAAAEYTPPTNETEAKLVEIWSGVLNIPQETIGIDANFFEIGGHSLKATTLVYKIEKAFGVTIGIKDIFTHSSARKLAARIQELEIVEYTQITPAKEKEYYALSSAQKRLYLLQQSDKESTSYNIPLAMQLTGSLDREKLETALHRLIARHESLRTSFHIWEGEPMQKIHDPETIDFAVEYYESPDIHQVISRFIRPYDLTQAPLLRVGLIRTTDRDHAAIKTGDSPTQILILDIHHIISDGTSIGIFTGDFLALYDGQELAPIRVQYKDYAEWQNSAKQQNKIDAQAGYWLMQFSDEIPVLELPTDFPRPPEKSFAGSMLTFTLSKEQTAALNDLAGSRETTLFMVLLAVYHILLAKLSRQDDIVIGVPTAGRRHADLEPLIGMFINTLALRNNSAGEKTFSTFLAKIKERTLVAFENQDYPYENLVEKLNAAHTGVRSRNPLFDVMFALQNVTIPELRIPGLTLTPYPFEMGTAKFDQTLIATETNDIIHFELEYSTKLFTADTGRRFITFFEQVLTQVLAAPGIELTHIEIVSEEERRRILYDFNKKVPRYTTDKTIHDLFAAQAAGTPDQIAVVDLEKNRQTLQGGSATLSYRELDEASAGLAARLVEKGVRPGEIVGIMAERSVEMIIGILGILKTGAAYLPINPRNPAARTDFMLQDCSASLLLFTPGVEKEVEHLSSAGVEKMVIETARTETGIRTVRDSSGQLAYVIYTSGSTGMPKGVPIAHANFCPLMYWGYDYLGLGGQDRVIQNLSYYFDWSVWEIFIALTSGAALYMIDEEILLNPEAEVAFIQENRISVLHITPSQYHYLMNVGEKLDTLRYLCLGAEKLTYDMLERSLASVNENCRVFNMYGPTEATIISAALEIDRAAYKEFKDLSSIPIGQPSANLQLHVLDKNLLLLPVNTPGELYIAGDGAAHGYLNNPELTAEKFAAFGESEPFCKKVPTPPKTFNESFLGVKGAIFQKSPLALYKTGDLARWLTDGSIEFLGRMDFQVKVRGYRIEPGEIENRLLNHPAIKEALVMTRQYENGENYLCGYIVPAGEAPDAGQIREYLSAQLPDYMTPQYFVFLEKMPLNPNGKVDTKALPEPDLSSSAVPYTPPRDEIENALTRIWTRVLDLDSAPGIDHNFFELGGHSLKATTLVTNIYKELGVNLEIADVFSLPTVRKQAARLKELEESKYAAVRPVELKEYYEMSYAQRRLWVLCQFEADSTAYNMPLAVIFSGNFVVPAFEQAVQLLAERHESFRTLFAQVSGAPFQYIVRKRDFKFRLEQVDLRNLEDETRQQETRRLYIEFANRVFNLEKGPLFFFKLARVEDKKWVLMFNMHHIVNDGWSQGVITNEIIRLYNACLHNDQDILPPMELQYKDYSRWHNHLIKTDGFADSRDYWLERFKDKPNGVELPYDHPRQAIQTFNGGRVSFTIDRQRAAGLLEISQKQDATLFMTLLTLVGAFLYRYTGQRDIIIGAPIANRKRPELNNIVGFLVNTLVYRHEINPDLLFKQQLNAVKQTALDGYRYQDYPFDLLIEQLALERDLSQSPIFNVMLAHNNAETANRQLGFEGVELSPYPYSEEFNMSKFDIIFFMDEVDEGILTRIEYNSDLFERSSCERMARNFTTFIDRVISDRDKKLVDLDVMTKQEYEDVVRRFNDTRCDFPDLILQQIFENQAAKTPDKTAVVAAGQGMPFHSMITYRELNSRVNRLAHFLVSEYGMKANRIIAISMDRSIEMIIVLMGVIKSGAAYLAVDPTYPRERVLHVLSNSSSDLLIIDKMRPELFADYTGKILDITTSAGKIMTAAQQNPPAINRPGDVLYVNYTSGSTGVPNGAMLSHDCLTNLIQWQNEKTAIDCSLRVLQFTSINFCVSFQEIMGTLTAGGEIHLIGDIERQDIDYLMDFLEIHRIEILFLPFSYLNFLFNETGRWRRSFKHSLKHIVTAGEQLKITVGLNRFLELNPTIKLHNHYGSTEMHVVTSYTLEAATAAQTPIPPAGKPIANVQIFILDEYFNPTPIGVYGELFVAGRTDILGYIANEELNRQKLIDLPHISPIRLYRSGDIGRWRPDGNIELRGRRDFMVKIRGFRVEPGEIESKILAIEQVRECVVVVKEDELRQMHLAAYVSVDNISAVEIRRSIGQELPQYMIPKIIILENLPLMPNGKVDRERLPEFKISIAEERVIAPPTNEVEQKLLSIWAEVLGIEEKYIGIDDNFFEIGGHSLKATTMMARIHKELDAKVELIEIFKTPTIREIASLARAIRWVKDAETTAPGAQGAGAAEEEKEIII